MHPGSTYGSQLSSSRFVITCPARDEADRLLVDELKIKVYSSIMSDQTIDIAAR